MATRKKPKHQYHHGDLRAALLSAAWALVSKQGVEALSLRAIAAQVGVSHAAPAHHFADKAALVTALRAEAWRRFTESLSAAAGAANSFEATGAAYVEFALAHPRQMELMLSAGRAAESPEVQQHSTAAWEVLCRVVGNTIGPKRAANPEELASMALGAWALAHGLAALFTGAALPLSLGESGVAMRQRALQVFVNGVKHG